METFYVDSLMLFVYLYHVLINAYCIPLTSSLWLCQKFLCGIFYHYQIITPLTYLWLVYWHYIFFSWDRFSSFFIFISMLYDQTLICMWYNEYMLWNMYYMEFSDALINFFEKSRINCTTTTMTWLLQLRATKVSSFSIEWK